MNKRFRELAAEAYRKVNPGPDVYDEADAAWMGFTDFEREFALLIVKECADVPCLMIGVNWEQSVKTGNTIKKHFGVE